MQRFKNVVLAIIISISALFIFNIFFLTELFHSMETEAKQIIYTSIEEADNKEIQLRLSKVTDDITGAQSISIGKSIQEDSVITTHKTEPLVVSIRNEKDMQQSVHIEEVDPNLTVFKDVIKEMRLAVHKNIDIIQPIDLHTLDSLFTIELNSKGIYTTVYYIEIVNVNTNEIIQASTRANRIDQTNGYTLLYNYYPEKGYAYKIYMDALTSGILKQMAGILISTLLIIVLLAIAFWYLIRTVLQQKTVEEIKNDFVNNITHELKTPIAVAYSAADTLLNFRQGEDKEKRIKYLQICIEQLTQLSGLVEQILSMSMERRKSIPLTKEHVPLNAVITQLIDLHRIKSNKELIFETHITPESITLYADPTHMNSILSNLIDNAIKYASQQVVIKIKAYEDELFSTVSIQDNGIGIDSSSIAHIFDKFYRVPNGNLHNVKGYGLGLFYVKQIVEKHGGVLSVKSKPNQGSIFTIQIPRG